MGGQSQERSGTKTTIRYQRQPFDKPSRQAGEEKQEIPDAHASMTTQSHALSAEDQTRVAEIAYALYEQRGRTDGHDLEDWFNAERKILT